VCDLGALAKTAADEIAEVIGLVVEAAGFERLVEFDPAPVDVVNGGAFGVPPVGVKDHVTAGAAEQSISVREQVDAGVELCHAAFMLRLKDCEVIDSGCAKPAHCLNTLERTKPIEGKERFVWADAHDAASAELGEVEGVVGRDG